MLHFLFPAHPLEPRHPDEIFAEQYESFSSRGFSVSLIRDDVIHEGLRLKGIPARSRVVYRGWMLNPVDYERMLAAIEAADAIPYITKSEYLAAHYLPNWYPLIAELTPETRVYPVDADMPLELRELHWGSFFVKDYVKSLKASVGSVIREPSEIGKVLEAMAEYRGEIEGGICIRRVADLIPESETRYFVIEGRAYSTDPLAAIPEIVRVCAGRIPSKYISVDVIRRRDGELRVVEVGDGQVSDLVGWSAVELSRAWARAAGLED